MIRKFFLLNLILILLAGMNLFAQDEPDSTKWKWDDEFKSDWGNSEWFGWNFHGNPFIEVNYGLGMPKLDKLSSKFADAGMAELKLGYATQEQYYSENVIEFHDKFSFVSKFSADLKSASPEPGEMKSDLWRFGFANRSGYGYKLDDISILPYYGSGFVWSKLDMIDYPANTYLIASPPITIDDARTDTDKLNRFHDAFRFGTLSEGGIRFEFGSFASVNFGYETAVIFPRYLFWKHMGNLIIEESAMGVLNHFIDEVLDSSPYAAPIVTVLLKNGLSYAFYSLKKKNMNWPFSTESPLTYETVKLGLTFTF